jgi:hypothetical protein
MSKYTCTRETMSRVRRIARGETFTAAEIKVVNGGTMPDEEWLNANFSTDGTVPMSAEDKAVRLSQGLDTPDKGATDEFEDVSDDPATKTGTLNPQGGIDDKPEDSWTKEAMQNWIVAKGYQFAKSATKAQLMAQVADIQEAIKAAENQENGDW